MSKRIPLLALAGLALLGGLWAGLVRLGWSLPVIPLPIAGQHGALMISGVLGTLITLERAVALTWRLAFIPPLLAGLGMLGLMFGLPMDVGRALITLSAFGLTLVFVRIIRLQPATFTAVMSLGALLWFVGDVLWLLRWPMQRVVLWWIGFLVLTIAGERLELSRLLRLGRWAYGTFIASVTVLLGGLLLSLMWLPLGWAVSGLGLLLLGMWLLVHDIARRTVRQRGLPRYIAICLLSGYGWLIAGGALSVSLAAQLDDLRLYDATLHSVLLGFVFSMIFGHAPIILPALFGRDAIYQLSFYFPLTLLHASLVVRVLGDVSGMQTWRLWGGLFNVIAVLVFFPMMMLTLRQSASGMARTPEIAG
ncbi:MAG: hypothetical protein ACT4QE_23965 [Anaerolineales bacterium]